MPDPFDGQDRLALQCYDGGQYVLWRSTWDFKLSHPERAHIEHNLHKVVETMAAPDEVRQSEVVSTCFIAYKKFDFYWVRPNISAPNPPGLACFAVVADRQKKLVKTFYPCRHPKHGKKLWPPPNP